MKILLLFLKRFILPAVVTNVQECYEKEYIQKSDYSFISICGISPILYHILPVKKRGISIETQ